MPSRPVALSPAELSSYRLALERRLGILTGEIALDRDKLEGDRQDASLVLDRKDQADLSVRAEIDATELERDLAEAREVHAALERIASGRYGTCLDCGEAIGRERLAVQPAAARCAACQAVFEGRQSRGVAT